jgi:hypothetical protein
MVGMDPLILMGVYKTTDREVNENILDQGGTEGKLHLVNLIVRQVRAEP